MSGVTGRTILRSKGQRSRSLLAENGGLHMALAIEASPTCYIGCHHVAL